VSPRSIQDSTATDICATRTNTPKRASPSRVQSVCSRTRTPPTPRSQACGSRDVRRANTSHAQYRTRAPTRHHHRVRYAVHPRARTRRPGRRRTTSRPPVGRWRRWRGRRQKLGERLGREQDEALVLGRAEHAVQVLAGARARRRRTISPSVGVGWSSPSMAWPVSGVSEIDPGESWARTSGMAGSNAPAGRDDDRDAGFFMCGRTSPACRDCAQTDR